MHQLLLLLFCCCLLPAPADAGGLPKVMAPLMDGLKRGHFAKLKQSTGVKFLAFLWKVLSNVFHTVEGCASFVKGEGLRLMLGYLTFDNAADWHVRVQTSTAMAMDTLTRNHKSCLASLMEAGGEDDADAAPGDRLLVLLTVLLPVRCSRCCSC